VSMVLEDRDGGLDAMVFSTNYERLASLVVEDQVVLVRGFVLPEENAPPKISVQDIVPLEVARVPLPSLISIRVWLGRKNGDAANTNGQGSNRTCVSPGLVWNRSLSAATRSRPCPLGFAAVNSRLAGPDERGCGAQE